VSGSFDGLLDPLVSEWFQTEVGEPTDVQLQAWSTISQGQDTLVAAPTGSGKTLAAFTWWLNELIVDAARGELQEATRVIYISPLKALGNDIKRNLELPLQQLKERATAAGVDLSEIRVATRSGDTPASQRNLMIRKPPHILITTPESFYIMLTAARSREFLKSADAVIVDEIHAVAQDKRGSHLALSLERLDLLCKKKVQRIGLSATQKPISAIARLLVGNGRKTDDGQPNCTIVDAGHRRDWELSVFDPGIPLGPIATHEIRGQINDEIVAQAAKYRSTLVFVNTRRLAERIAHELTQRLGEGKVATHHGSLSKETRLAAEQGLKLGEVPIVVATASLELGIDIGHVDLVCHIGAPRALATLLQRIGRSGHQKGGISRGILFPLTRDELVQCAAAVKASHEGQLDELIIPKKPLDILAQQVVATVAGEEEIDTETMFTTVKNADPYTDLTRETFEEILDMLTDGVASSRGRRGTHLHRDRVNEVLRPRRGARLAAITSGGAIPDVADYDVIEEPQGNFVGKVNEDFAIESMAGNIFLLGNTSWRITRIEAGKVRVVNASGAPPTIPFWTGEAPARTAELSEALSELREEVGELLPDEAAAKRWLQDVGAVTEGGAEQIVDYISEAKQALGTLPTTKRVVAERFFDESGGMQLVVHSPFGARINRAWGLSLRKRFCVNFDFELQAAATDDGIVLSLGDQHSFPLNSIFGFVRAATAEDTLVQALLPSPMFENRWRWNATRSLALLRHSGGKKVPMPLIRMRAEDLLAAVFPEQVACQENTVGPIHPPDHPLVNETVDNCLREAMDIDSLKDLLLQIEAGEIELVSVETPAPSPLSHEILNANPYAFLDDAPLEERRARAVSLRRTDPSLAGGAGALDQEAIDSVVESASPDIRNPEELHDLLVTVGIVPTSYAAQWNEHIDELRSSGRATVATFGDAMAYVAAESLPTVTAAIPGVSLDPPLSVPKTLAGRPSPSEQEARKDILRGWLGIVGPTTAGELAKFLGLETSLVDATLLHLEGTGAVMRGSFRKHIGEVEWCDRRLLARIHRLTIQTLRAEIEPVPAADMMRFLFRWQHVADGTQLHGQEGVAEVIRQLQGMELPAPSWDEHIMPARIRSYDRGDLDRLCLSGIAVWGRFAPPEPDAEPNGRKQSANRATPISFVLRDQLQTFSQGSRDFDPDTFSTAAQDVAAYLGSNGPSFLQDVISGTKRLPTEVDEALWELVSGGLVTGDGVVGLRRLLADGRQKQRRRLRSVTNPRSKQAYLPSGRWSLLQTSAKELTYDEKVEAFTRQLLLRYGVVFRELLSRERNAPPWRVIARLLRSWEAQQRVRGGRFVAGFTGEQFAIPEAVESLRAVRRNKGAEEVVIIGAADPLNLVGIVTVGDRISSQSKASIRFRNGVFDTVGDRVLLEREATTA
jgi:ATP-dependent Lhr-like helicase